MSGLAITTRPSTHPTDSAPTQTRPQSSEPTGPRGPRPDQREPRNPGSSDRVEPMQVRPEPPQDRVPSRPQLQTPGAGGGVNIRGAL
ncbi:MAG: hypothetical protein ACAI38_11770 [Myxococcota bacterium]